MQEAVEHYPGEPSLLRSLSYAYSANLQHDSAVAVLRRAVVLDPRSVAGLRLLGGVLMGAGRWTDAREPLQRALALAPGDLATTLLLISSWLADGDLDGARGALNNANPPGGRAGLLAYVSMYGDHYWLLDQAQQDTVLGVGVDRFDGDAGSRALVFAQILHARADDAGARRWAEIAAREFETIAATSMDPQIEGLTGLALAYQGRHAEARRWLDRGVAGSRTLEQERAAYPLELSARGRLLAGDTDGALTELEAWARLRPDARWYARLHPEFAPLRGNPRFARIAR